MGVLDWTASISGVAGTAYGIIQTALPALALPAIPLVGQCLLLAAGVWGIIRLTGFGNWWWGEEENEDNTADDVSSLFCWNNHSYYYSKQNCRDCWLYIIMYIINKINYKTSKIKNKKMNNTASII